MSNKIMHDYIQRVIKPYVGKNKCLLLMDEFSAHSSAEVDQFLIS